MISCLKAFGHTLKDEQKVQVVIHSLHDGVKSISTTMLKSKLLMILHDTCFLQAEVVVIKSSFKAYVAEIFFPLERRSGIRRSSKRIVSTREKDHLVLEFKKNGKFKTKNKAK